MPEYLPTVPLGPSSSAELLPLPTFAERRGKSVRTVQRWVAGGELPGAVQDDDGRWWIPGDAQRLEAPAPTPPTSRTTTSATSPPTSGATYVLPYAPPLELEAPRAAEPELGQLVTLEAAAAQLGTNTHGVRRMADAGLLHVGPYGPRGSLRVFLPPA